MDSKALFQASCEHRGTGRHPIDYLAHPETDRRLRDYYGVESEGDLLDALDSDFYYLSCRDISQNESSLPYYRGPELEAAEKERICPFGIRWTRGSYNSKFAVDEVISHPFGPSTTLEDILRHPWPEVSWFDFEPMLEECEAQSGRVIVGGFWSGIFGDSYRMLGIENFLLDMAMRPDVVKTLVDRMTEFYLELNDRLFSMSKGRIDIFFFGNDFGTQNGLIFSKDMWEEFFFENIKKLTSLAHGYGLKVMMHSCGAIAELLHLLIEAGVDIIDPVQVTSVGMDPGALKAGFGDSIVFHGGIDTQQVLPRATPDEVYRHAVETMGILGRDGGYIFAPSQILNRDVPVENIDAMYRAARAGYERRVEEASECRT